MKILQMVDVPWDSGLAHYALSLSQGLKKSGHQVYVSTRPGEKPWIKAHRLGLRTVPLVTLKGLGPLRRFLKEHRIDLINAHTGAMHSLAVAGALGQKVAVVRTRSDARVLRRHPGGRFLYNHTQGVIAAADYIRESFVRELKLSPRKVTTIFQGLDLSEFTVGPLPQPPILGIVARLDPVKGHRYLIEALSILRPAYPDLRVRFIGQEENIKERDLRHIAERLRLEDRIEFMGYQTDIPRVMEACSIGVIASTGSEAVSRVALEWMAAGRPVVATRVGCLPEVVQEKVTGLLAEPKDAPSLAAALAKILHDPAKASAMGKAARQRAEERFGLPRFIDETTEVYEESLREARKN